MPNDGTMIEFDPFSAGTDHDPYRLYALLREEEPVHHDTRYGFYALSRFEDVRSVSSDWHRFSNAQGIDIDHSGEHFGPNFVSSDPPRHRVIRRLLQPRFSRGAVTELLEPVVRERVAGLVANLRTRVEIDLARDVAWPLPFSVACDLLGFPVADHKFLWDASRRFEEREVGRPVPPSSAAWAARELREYVARQAERRRSSGNDLISLLVSAEVDGEPLSHEEVVGNAFVLLNAGSQTTACLLTNAFVLLHANPEQLAWLQENPHEVPRAVEEILRFEAPIQHFTRTTTEDVKLHGTRIPRGSKVVLLYGAANRDPNVWSDPDRLDLSRDPKRHVAFGDGIHHCLGAPIARLEARVALEALLPSLVHFRLTDTPIRLRSHQLRGYVSLPTGLG
jgi:cytochrome P450